MIERDDNGAIKWAPILIPSLMGLLAAGGFYQVTQHRLDAIESQMQTTVQVMAEVAKLTADIAHTRADLLDLKSEIRDLRAAIMAQARNRTGGMVTVPKGISPG